MKDFKGLIAAIDVVHAKLQMQAAQAVNVSLTTRNWIIGFFIVEFEQAGRDRAEYGERLIEELAKRLVHIKGIDKRSLYRFRMFYQLYPYLQKVIPTSILQLGGAEWSVGDRVSIVGTASPLLENDQKVLEMEGEKWGDGKVGTLSPLFENWWEGCDNEDDGRGLGKVGTLSPLLENNQKVLEMEGEKWGDGKVGTLSPLFENWWEGSDNEDDGCGLGKVGTLSPLLENDQKVLEMEGEKWGDGKVGTLSPLFENWWEGSDNEDDGRGLGKVGTLSPLLGDAKISSLEGTLMVNLNEQRYLDELRVPAKEILTKLSYSHIELLLNIPEHFKRAFYELECIRGTWNVRELRRQIQSNYFERCGFSKDPGKLADEIRKRSKPLSARDVVKNVYAFEFLDLPLAAGIEESDLETALLDRLQAFILELGHGFCFEGRQKRILVGGQYYFLDLLFYHRILKCHVVFELKLGAFEPSDLGQLNMYLNFTRAEISEADDRPPLGILLVAQKNEALVKYSSPGMDDHLFVQEYLLQLPTEGQLMEYFLRELQDLMR